MVIVLYTTELLKHTGISAGWCPVCGDCICPDIDYGKSDEHRHPNCALHHPYTPHGIISRLQAYADSG